MTAAAAHNVSSAYGWALVWLPGKMSRTGFVAGFTFKTTRREVVESVSAQWARSGSKGETQYHAWKRIRASGGKVVRVELRELDATMRQVDGLQRQLVAHMLLVAKMECLTPVKRVITEERRATFDDCGNCLPCKARRAYPLQPKRAAVKG